MAMDENAHEQTKTAHAEKTSVTGVQGERKGKKKLSMASQSAKISEAEMPEEVFVWMNRELFVALVKQFQ